MFNNNINPGIDAVFMPGKIHGCEDELYIIYYNENANDGNGSVEIEIVDYETLLKVYEDADHNADKFFGILPDYFHGRWQYADAPSDEYLSLVAAYETADFIVGRDGDMDAEMKFIIDWAMKRKEANPKPPITVGEGVGFDRIRRVTGYLVGTVERFNDAKRAEERDRVKHTITEE